VRRLTASVGPAGMLALLASVVTPLTVQAAPSPSPTPASAPAGAEPGPWLVVALVVGVVSIAVGVAMMRCERGRP
jgi:hypothetical protein